MSVTLNQTEGFNVTKTKDKCKNVKALFEDLGFKIPGPLL